MGQTLICPNCGKGRWTEDDSEKDSPCVKCVKKLSSNLYAVGLHILQSYGISGFDKPKKRDDG